MSKSTSFQLWPFYAATLGAAILVMLAALFPEFFVIPALIWLGIYGLTAGSEFEDIVAINRTEKTDALPVLLGAIHFPILLATIWSLAHSDGIALLAHGLAAGIYFGQVSVPVAHELIHRADRPAFQLGMWIYITLLFGHHTSSHRLVHHVHVATKDDPNTAKRGRSLYRFVLSAWIGSFRAGLKAERKRSAKPYPPIYLIYGAGSMAGLVVSYLIAGWMGVGIHLFLGLYATFQLLSSDYVQHYGLRRHLDDTGRPEHVGPQHSWDAPQRRPQKLMLNAPRHSAHHLRPQLKYNELAHNHEAPVLPHSLAVMGFIALFPRWWRAVMDPRLDQLG